MNELLGGIFQISAQMQIYLSFLWLKTYVWISSWRDKKICVPYGLGMCFSIYFSTKCSFTKPYPAVSFAKHSKFENILVWPSCHFVFVCYFKIFKCFPESFEYKLNQDVYTYLVLKIVRIEFLFTILTWHYQDYQSQT